jgi:type II secretory ATPase GspE/PulE/Tfp pilus assembly ATPase PilB-like protein
VSQGMRTLVDEALTLVENDVTTVAEVVRTLYAA